MEELVVAPDIEERVAALCATGRRGNAVDMMLTMFPGMCRKDVEAWMGKKFPFHKVARGTDINRMSELFDAIEVTYSVDSAEYCPTWLEDDGAPIDQSGWSYVIVCGQTTFVFDVRGEYLGFYTDDTGWWCPRKGQE